MASELRASPLAAALPLAPPLGVGQRRTARAAQAVGERLLRGREGARAQQGAVRTGRVQVQRPDARLKGERGVGQRRESLP